jgi:glyoxylase-like metal-dependent hydrolase (beta-lactamase superfamily II)
MLTEMIWKNIYKISTVFDKTGVVFLYLFVTKNGLVIIDTGASDSPKSVLEPALSELGMELRDISVILNSHAHLDHSGGNKEVKSISGAKIYLHPGDLFMARSVEAQTEYHVGPLRELGFPQEAIEQRVAHVKNNAGEEFEPDFLLKDGEVLDFGDIQLRVIHLPGHSPGLTGFYLENPGILFSADGIQGQGARPGSFPYIFYTYDYRKSLEKVLSLKPNWICLGHAYHGGSLVNYPVRKDEDAKRFINCSISVSEALRVSTEKVMNANKDAEIKTLARLILDDLLFEIPQLRMRSTGFPLLAGPTILSSIKEFYT